MSLMIFFKKNFKKKEKKEKKRKEREGSDSVTKHYRELSHKQGQIQRHTTVPTRPTEKDRD
jgi:hypothetical protein